MPETIPETVAKTREYDGPPDYRNVGIHGMSPQT